MKPFLDIQNVSNRKNVWAEYYDPTSMSTFEYHMTGIIPLFNYRLEF